MSVVLDCAAYWEKREEKVKHFDKVRCRSYLLQINLFVINYLPPATT